MPASLAARVAHVPGGGAVAVRCVVDRFDDLLPSGVCIHRVPSQLLHRAAHRVARVPRLTRRACRLRWSRQCAPRCRFALSGTSSCAGVQRLRYGPYRETIYRAPRSPVLTLTIRVVSRPRPPAPSGPAALSAPPSVVWLAFTPSLPRQSRLRRPSSSPFGALAVPIVSLHALFSTEITPHRPFAVLLRACVIAAITKRDWRLHARAAILACNCTRPRASVCGLTPAADASRLAGPPALVPVPGPPPLRSRAVRCNTGDTR